MFRPQPVPRIERTTRVIEHAGVAFDPLPSIEYFTKDQKGQISDDSYDVIAAVLNAHVPSPTNPAVLFKAAREWYLAYGGHNAVLACIIDQLVQVEGFGLIGVDLDVFKKARKEFEEATHVKQPA